MKKIFKHGEIIIKISYNKCTGSGECVEACPMNIIELQDDKAVITDISKCIECCACVNACPNRAIEHSSCP